MNRKTSIRIRLAAGIMAAVLFVTGIPLQAVAEEAKSNEKKTSDSGMQMSLQWNQESPYVNGNTFDLTTSDAKTVNASMILSYNSRKVREEGYAAGELVITVEGIGSAYRSGAPEVAVGADAASNTEKTRDWSYTYDRKTDTFTFTNNEPIQHGSVFSGYFELVFPMDPRRCQDLYTKDIHASMLLPEGGSIEVEPLHFSVDTVVDTYHVGIEAQSLYSTAGLKVENPQDYFWRKYPLDGERLEHSRGVKNGETYYLTIPEEAVLYSPYLDVEQVDDTKYQVDLATGSSSIKDTVYILYPREQFANTEAEVTLEARGTYWEGLDGSGVEEEVILGEDTAKTAFPGASDFDFLLPPGGGDGGYGRVYKDDSFDGVGKYGADVLGSTLKDGEVLTWRVNGSASTYGEEQLGSMQVIDDFQYIALKDGGWRLLTGKDYEHVSVTLPSNKEVININDQPLTPDLYSVRIYAVTSDRVMEENEKTLVYDGAITTSSQKIELPEGTTAVSVRFDDLGEIIKSFEYTIDTKYHIQDPKDQVDFETGRVRNTLLMKFYDGNGQWVEEKLATEDNYIDEAGLNLAQRDLDTYGHYQIRSDAQVTFYGKDAYQSDYQAFTGLEPFKATDAGFMSTLSFGMEFSMDEGQRFDQFSIYTILPEGLNLTGRANTAEQLWNDLTLSGLGLKSDTLAEHADLEMIKDYKGSGRTYLALHFDVTGLDIDYTKDVSASLGVDASKTWYQKNGVSFQVRSAAMVDAGDAYREQAKYPDDGTWEEELWSDLNGNGDTEELLSFAFDYRSVTYAASSQFEMNKWIESSYSDGLIQLPDIAEIGMGEDYFYTIRLINGASVTRNLVVYDNLENGDDSKWHGTLKEVDLSDAEELGLTATVYYSKDRNAGTLETGDWSPDLEPSQAESIAVVFDGELKEGDVLDLVLRMQAPSTGNYKGEVTENQYRASFTMLDPGTGTETETESLTSNEVQGKLITGYKDITVRKEDEVNGTTLKDAEFTLLDKKTKEPVATAVSNAKGYAVFERIPQEQSYILRETKAPEGYELADDIEVSLKDKDLSLKVEDPRTKGTITIKKVNAMDGAIPVGNATYTIYKSDGTEAGTFTTEADGVVTIEDLDWDRYTIKETSAPEGYEVSTDIVDFEVNRENAATVQEIRLKDDQVATGVTLTKYEADINGKELDSTVEGALFDLYRITDEKDLLVGTYMTGPDGTIHVEDLVFGNYEFREKRAPEGYKALEEPVAFKISPSKPYTEVEAVNDRKPGSIRLFKLDEEETPVAGGTYKLMDEAGLVIGEYTTNENGYVDINGLEWGSYTLLETKAPDGYLLDEMEHKVTIEKDTIQVEVRSVEQRKAGSVVLTKYDETGTISLDGAEFALYKTDGTLVKEGLVTGDDGTLQVDDLKWGSYYFKETKAPNGYGLNDEPVRFSVNAITANSVQQVSVKDPQDSKVITVTKRLKADEINFANGDPSFVFCLNGSDVNGNKREYNRIVTFTEDYVRAHTDEDGYVSQSVTFSGLLAGVYTVHEEETSRFELEEISDVNNGMISGKYVMFFMDTSNEASCTYTNRSYESQWYSHATGISNVLKESTKMTGLTVLYNGPDTLDSGTKIDRDQLTVYANYDDGTSILVPDDMYELSIDTVPQVSGDYTVDVSYTDAKGMNGTGSFTFHVNMTIVPIGIEATTSDEVFPGNYPISSDDFRYQIIMNDGSRIPVTDADLFEVTVGNTSPDGEMEQETACDILENKTGTQDVPYVATFVINGKEYVYEGMFSVDTAHTIGNPEDMAIGEWDPENLAENTAFYITDSYDAFVFGPGVDEHIIPEDADMNYHLPNAQEIRSITFQDGISMKYMDYMFYNFTSLETVYNLPKDVECMAGTFQDCANLKNICDLPNNVIDLTNTFYRCTNMEKAPALPDTVTDFHDSGSLYSTFAGCSNLREIKKMPTSIEGETDLSHEIWYTFDDCLELTKMPKLPEGSTNLWYVFNDCENLADISAGLPETATGLYYTFGGCESLKETPQIPDGVTAMVGTFVDCTVLETVVNFPENLIDLTTCFYNRQTDVGCSNLVNVPDIPYGCKEMDDAFRNCTVLTRSPAIPATVTAMASTFRGCSSLTEIPALAYTEESDLENGTYLEGEIIGERVMDEAFHGTAITEAPDIPYGTKSLVSTFQECNSLLVAPEIPDGVTSMNGTFSRCANLKKVGDLPDTVENLNYVFNECYQLIEVGHLSDGAKYMDRAFYSCSRLESVPNIPANAQSMIMCFNSCGEMINIPELPDTVTNLQAAFGACRQLKELPNIPDKVQNLTWAFQDCSMLEDISCTIPETAKYIGSAFQRMPNAYGVVEFNTDTTSFGDIFGGDTGKNGPGIEIYGTSSHLDEIAATGQYVTVREGY